MMTFYGPALFIHVVFAILLVGGSAYTHLGMALVHRARSVDSARSHVMWLHAIVKVTGPFAAVVLATGVFMAFAGDWWGMGWPAISLALFTLAGVTAIALVDPRVARLRAALDELPDGPITPEVGVGLVDPRLRLSGWALTGVDLAIVFLMTNKPGWTGSIVAGVIGLVAGGLAGVLANRSSGAPTQPMPASPPAAPAA